MKKVLYFTLSCVLLLAFTACNKTKKQADNTAKETDYKARVDQYAPFDLKTDLSKLTENEKQMLPILIDVAKHMENIFWQQAYGDKEALMKAMPNDDARAFASIHYGPWDRLNGNKPFVKEFGAKPLGANFYPKDMTKEEFEALEDPAKDSWYTVIRRDKAGKLMVVPYHEAYKEDIQAAAAGLMKAAELAEDQGLKTYLNLRAEALLTGEYLASDLAWMDMQTNTIDFVVGPIENYEDALFGYKAACSAQILVKDKEWSKRLSVYGALLPRIQNAIPVPAEYKAEKANSNADMNAYDVIYYGGDCNAGSKNIAINLPNDPRVHAQKGSRKLQLKNAMQAKFEKILIPIAKEVMTPDQVKYVNFNAFFENTMFHEVAHGLGVNYTIKDGKMVRNVLADTYTSIEEGKADILGLYIITLLHEWDMLQDEDLMTNYVTFMAGTFRSVRFGAASAHGKANMIRFNYFKNKGAFTLDENGKYVVNFEIMKTATKELVHDIIMIQGDGDYAKAKEMIETLGNVPEKLQQDLDRINSLGIPKDIRYNQGVEVLGL